LDRNSSLIHFERTKELEQQHFAVRSRPISPQLVATTLLTYELVRRMGGGIQKLFSSPTMDTVINNIIKDLSSDPKSGVRGVDTSQWAEYLKDVIEVGSQEVVATLAEQAKNQAAQVQPAQSAVAQPQSATSTSTATPYNLTYNYGKSGIYSSLDKIAMEGVGGKIFEWAKDKGESFVTNMKNFLVGAKLDDLGTQLATAAVKEGYIPEEGIEPLKEYIMKAVEKGLSSLTNQVSQQTSQQSQQQMSQQQQTSPTKAESAIKEVMQSPQEMQDVLSQFDAYKQMHQNLTDAQIFELILKARILNEKGKMIN